MNQERLHQLLLTMKSEYERARAEGAKIIFLDEAVFSAATMLSRSWSAKNESIEITDKRSTLIT